MILNCHYHICISKDPPLFLGKFAVELAGVLGFHSLAIDFPVLSAKPSSVAGDFNVFISAGPLGYRREANRLTFTLNSENEAASLLQTLTSDFSALFPTSQRAKITTPPSGFQFASDKPMQISTPGESASIGIENFLLLGAWLKDLNGDFLPDFVDVGLDIAENATLDTYSAAADIACVLGAQTTSYSFPLIASDRTGMMHFRASAAPASVWVDEHTVYFEGRDLSAFTSRLLALVLPGNSGKTPSRLLDSSGRPRAVLPLSAWLAHLRDDFAMRQTDGQFAWALALGAADNSDLSCFFNPDAVDWNKRNRLFKKTQVHSYKADQTIWELKRSFPWEVNRFKAAFRNKALPKVRPGDKVVIRAALSEDKQIRSEVASEIKTWVESKGAEIDIRLISAYKQGFSWIDEFISPQLKTIKGIDRIEILFKSYLPEGKSQFLEEDGAVPKITSVRADDPEHWFDLPIRPLQELYPIDDILAAELHLERSRIEFDYYQGEEDLTYLVIAFNEKGDELLREQLKTVWAERPYLDRYPDIGKVHPPTGYINVSINDEIVLQDRIKTDLELVWDVYQSEVLPAVTEVILKTTGGAITSANQPFFSKLELNLEISEPDFDLPTRTDRFSALDALHEDLYFVGLDYFRTLGLRETGEVISSPGLILPVIRKKTGKPKLRVKLTERLAHEPQIRKNQTVLAGALAPSDVRLSVTSIKQESGGLAVYLSIIGPESLGKVVEAYSKLAAECRLKNAIAGVGVSTVHCSLGGKPLITWHLPAAKKLRLNGRAMDPDKFEVPQTEVIGYQEYINLITQAQRIPGFRVYPVAESYQGRMIHAIEVLPDPRGWLPRVKWISAQPSVYINARHHANEVSSTNTNFNLVKALAVDPELRKLSKSLNLVMVPFENPDGAAIHYELMQDNPRWKLHVARYNALGTELATEYFKDDTFQTEAKAFTRVWREWLPDVIVDDHGVPTHEWDQPFSGYTSPWFKGFWLPRALLYGYFFHINEPGFESNLMVNKAVEHVVAESLKKDDRIISLNREWRDRFYTYANKWLPSLFPANYYQDIITYWIPSPYKSVHNYASVRFPWVTAVSFVAEVSDETAQGKYLELCALAHFNQDVAILEMLADSAVCMEQSATLNAHGTQLTWHRKRPLICKTADGLRDSSKGGAGD